MKTIVFSPLAQSDVSDIWDYTINHWGIKQAITYTQNLRNSSRDIADGRAIGRVVDIRDGYFKYRSGEHFIFYRESEAEVIVIRVLHKTMDVGRHL